MLRGAAGDSVISVYERAMAQVWLRLEALAQQHGVMDQLQVFVAVRPRQACSWAAQTLAACAADEALWMQLLLFQLWRGEAAGVEMS